MGKLLLGIDVGATGCKVCLYDNELTLKASSYHETPLLFPGGGLVEADPEKWWESCVKGIREVLAQAEGEVVAIGVSGTNATIALGPSGEPLYNAIMQLDLRSVPLAEEIEKELGKERVWQITGNRIAAGTFSLPTILWMKRNLAVPPGRRITFLVPTSYIVFKLTGKKGIDYSRAATTLLFDYHRKTWATELLRDLGIREEELPQIYPPWEIVGGVDREAAEFTGLKVDTPVVAGCMDTVASMLGAGLIEEGQVLLTLGTVGRISLITRPENWRPEFLNCHHGVENKWLSIALINTAGACLRWYRELVGASYATLNEEAATVQPGSEGLIFLPYLAGEKSPVWDPLARGIFFGLRLHHTRAHLYRAVLEGLSLAIRHNLELMAQGQPQGFSLYVGGGGAGSQVWLEVLASVLGRPLLVLKIPETEPLGAAWLAGKGIREVKQCTRGEALIQRTVLPREDLMETYTKLLNIYRELYASNQRLFKNLSGG